MVFGHALSNLLWSHIPEKANYGTHTLLADDSPTRPNVNAGSDKIHFHP
jgi:hypothetical protein